MNFIQVRNVSHGYTAGGFFSKRHKVQVLKGLDLDLQAGQSLGLLGSSGSGKSTLARLLMGLETPDQGSIEFEGQPLQGLNPLFLQRVQMVFKTPSAPLTPYAASAGALPSHCATCQR